MYNCKLRTYKLRKRDILMNTVWSAKCTKHRVFHTQCCEKYIWTIIVWQHWFTVSTYNKCICISERWAACRRQSSILNDKNQLGWLWLIMWWRSKKEVWILLMHPLTAWQRWAGYMYVYTQQRYTKMLHSRAFVHIYFIRQLFGTIHTCIYYYILTIYNISPYFIFIYIRSPNTMQMIFSLRLATRRILDYYYKIALHFKTQTHCIWILLCTHKYPANVYISVRVYKSLMEENSFSSYFSTMHACVLCVFVCV